MYTRSNRPYMRARIGLIQEQQWAVYGGKNGPYIRAAMGHIWGQEWATF